MDLHCFEPDAPPSEQLLHFFLDSTSELISVFENVIQRQVCNSVSDKRNGNVAQLVIGQFGVLVLEIVTKSLEALERTKTISVH